MCLRSVLALVVCGVFVAPALAQNAQPPSPANSFQPSQIQLQHRPEESETSAPVPPTIALTVPRGTPLEITLDKELRVKHVGQPVRGRLVEAVYAFDKLVIPAGSEVTGRITQIEAVSAGRRTESALNADFTPPRKVEIEFDDVSLPGGKQLSIETRVTPGSGQLLDFVSSPGNTNPEKSIGSEAAAKTHEAKQLAHDQWNAVMKQAKAPGKLHRLEHYAIEQLPAHPQYIDAGAIYFAELQAPLDFGSEPLTPQMARSIGDISPTGGVVHARLEMAVTSASNHKGDTVSAVITQPLFENGRLIVPEGSVLEGSVAQVRPARRLNKNGQLRVAFHELRLPDGVPQAIEANLESVQAGKSANVKLDSEGGAQATTPKTRYLSTAVEIGLAGLAARGDPDAKTANPSGTTGSRMAGGIGGYKLVGALLGAFVQSRAFSYSMGGYGAGMSVYTHFIARGQDVIFPKDTAMQIGLGIHDSTPQTPAQQQPARSGN
ncbi:MAG: hypothetical protein ACRD40_19835 [Candidatus Acidiferrales bacterium]